VLVDGGAFLLEEIGGVDGGQAEIEQGFDGDADFGTGLLTIGVNLS
jgi:hypothetical protein